MQQIILIYGFIGIITLLFGLYLLTRKPVVMSRRIDMLILCLMLLIPNITKPFLGVVYILYILIFFLLMMIMIFILMKDKYSVINTKVSSAIHMVTYIFDQKNIRYKLSDLHIDLTDYEDSKITFKQSFNSVEISLRSIRKLPFYRDLIECIKMQAKQIPEKVFPTWGVFYIIAGIILICLFALLWK